MRLWDLGPTEDIWSWSRKTRKLIHGIKYKIRSASI